MLLHIEGTAAGGQIDVIDGHGAILETPRVRNAIVLLHFGRVDGRSGKWVAMGSDRSPHGSPPNTQLAPILTTTTQQQQQP